MDLKIYHGKKVEILADNGELFRGKITDYFYPDENENNLESIIMDTSDGRAIEFYKDDIKTITII